MMSTVPVPDSLEEALSPGWLSSALQPRFPGIEVRAVVPGPVVDRISSNARFRIECAGGIPDGLSPDLCIKGFDALASHGITPPSWERAWRNIGRGMVHGFFLWGITTKVEPTVIATLLHRLGTAIADHQAL